MATIESLQAQVIALQASEAKLTAENEKLKADNEKLFQFIIQVNGTEEHVEKMIVERMSKEFIDGNQDWWDQMELFQEKEECLECGKSMEYDAETEKNKCFDGCAPH